MTFAVEELLEYPARKVCKLLRLKKSTYYKWRKRIPCYEYTNEECAHVERMFLEHNGSFGRRVIKRELQREGICYSERKISKILHILGYTPKYGRKKGKNVHTSEYTEEKYIHENAFWQLPEDSRQRLSVWSMDFTEVKVAGKKLYICGAISVNGKVLVSCEVSDRCTAELAVMTLEKAISQYGVPDMVMTDRGSQFTSKAFYEAITKHTIKHSMSRPRTPRDNRYIETFWKSMKTEIGKMGHLTVKQYTMLVEYYAYYYNNKRPHSALNYLPPLKYAQLECAQQQNNFVI